MTLRDDVIDAFLAQAGWPAARRTPLAGDASFRKYERVFLNGRQAVLMDAPPEKEDVRPFIHVAQHLAAYGMSAPRILACDVVNGLLLLEDLGDDLFTHVLHRQPEREEALYLAAADVLVELHNKALAADYTSFLPYDDSLLMRECSLFSEWFMPAVMETPVCAVLSEEYTTLWRRLIMLLPALRPVLTLRDFHADNLLWLPDRVGHQRVGLLDFQDAVIGLPAYDMVSFLEDARRDVKASTVECVLHYYLERTGIPADIFYAAYALIGAQRNCKIIGIFARLAVRDGKRQYLSYLPRVWGHLARDLQHPLLKPLRDWMDKAVPTELRGVITPGSLNVRATV